MGNGLGALRPISLNGGSEADKHSGLWQMSEGGPGSLLADSKSLPRRGFGVIWICSELGFEGLGGEVGGEKGRLLANS